MDTGVLLRFNTHARNYHKSFDLPVVLLVISRHLMLALGFGYFIVYIDFSGRHALSEAIEGTFTRQASEIRPGTYATNASVYLT